MCSGCSAPRAPTAMTLEVACSKVFVAAVTDTTHFCGGHTSAGAAREAEKRKSGWAAAGRQQTYLVQGGDAHVVIAPPVAGRVARPPLQQLQVVEDAAAHVSPHGALVRAVPLLVDLVRVGGWVGECGREGGRREGTPTSATCRYVGSRMSREECTTRYSRLLIPPLEPVALCSSQT